MGQASLKIPGQGPLNDLHSSGFIRYMSGSGFMDAGLSMVPAQFTCPVTLIVLVIYKPQEQGQVGQFRLADLVEFR